MKALIQKDLYVLWKQLRVFLLIILVFSAMNGAFGAAFPIVYCAMLPYSALAYDERSNWNRLAAMMPYSTADLVISKYILGWLCTLAAAVCSSLCRILFDRLMHTADYSLAATAAAIFLSFCILALSLPAMFRFGVEKGRLIMLLTIFLVCGGAGTLGSIAENVNVTGLLSALTLILPGAALILTAVSVPLSLGICRRQAA